MFFKEILLIFIGLHYVIAEDGVSRDKVLAKTFADGTDCDKKACSLYRNNGRNDEILKSYLFSCITGCNKKATKSSCELGCNDVETSVIQPLTDEDKKNLRAICKAACEFNVNGESKPLNIGFTPKPQENPSAVEAVPPSEPGKPIASISLDKQDPIVKLPENAVVVGGGGGKPDAKPSSNALTYDPIYNFDGEDDDDEEEEGKDSSSEETSSEEWTAGNYDDDDDDELNAFGTGTGYDDENANSEGGFNVFEILNNLFSGKFNGNSGTPIIAIDPVPTFDIDGKKPEDTSNTQDESEQTSIIDIFRGLIDKTDNIIKNLKGTAIVVKTHENEDGQREQTIQRYEDGQMVDNQFKILPSLNDLSFSNKFIANNDESKNWKGIPLAIPVPIDEEFLNNNDQYESQYPGSFRYCMPIKLHFSTFCEDINNIFNCASIHTGLPRWFFLIVVLITSLLFIWMGIFLLSMIRRMRKERRHYAHDGYLPLYKDIDFQIETRIEAGPLPEKQKLPESI